MIYYFLAIYYSISTYKWDLISNPSYLFLKITFNEEVAILEYALL